MRFPPAHTAPDAIRSLAKAMRDGVLHFRRPELAAIRRSVVVQLRERFEQAPPDEIVFPIHRTGSALAGPGGTFYVPMYDHVPSFLTGYGYDRIAARAHRRARLLGPSIANLPPTWSVRFYETVAWPPEKPQEGVQSSRLAFRIERGASEMEIPIHDANEAWGGTPFKAKPPRFPLQPSSPFRGYFVISDDVSQATYCQWLTVYLAQRSFLTEEEEREAVRAFFLVGAPDTHPARLAAYDRAKRRFVQPVGGRPSFGSYLHRSTIGALREEAGRTSMGIPLEDPSVDRDGEGRGPFGDGGGAVFQEEPSAEQAVDGDEADWADVARRMVGPTSSEVPPDLIEVKLLRWSEPKLHRALLDRIKTGAVQTLEFGDRTFVRTLDADRVEKERRINAAVRAKAPHSRSQRARWESRLARRGLSLPSARRTIARWINHRRLTASEIDARVADRERRHRLAPRS